ncbi:MAG TPA: PAS domain S-box protein [Burkholderiaceae bacterium]|nr:PAS domain S-box protein [Burkholderiaceae bacterium]
MDLTIRTFMDCVTDAVFVHEEGGTVLDANPRACESLGYSREELIGMSLRDYDAVRGEGDAVIRGLRERLDAGEVVSFESIHRRKDGTVFPVEVRVRRFLHGGRRLSLRSVRDITEKTRAMSEHEEHVQFLENLDKLNRAIQSSTDVELMIGNALDAVMEIFHCDRAVLGAHSSQSETTSFKIVAKREKAEYPGGQRAGTEFQADGDFSAMSAEVKASSGPVQYAMGSVSLSNSRVMEHFGVQSVLSMAIETKLDQRDQFHHFTLCQCSHARVWTPQEVRLFQEIGRRFGDAITTLSTLRDLRRSEAYLAEAQRLAHTGSWAWDAKRKEFVHWSRGPSRSDGIEGKRAMPSLEAVRQRIHPDDRALWSERVESAIRERRDFDLEYRVALRDGTIRYYRTVAHPVVDSYGELVEFVGTDTDVTAQKKVDAEHSAYLDFLRSVDRINRAIQGTSDLERMASNVLATVLDIYGCDRVQLLYPCDPDAVSWRAVMEHTRPEVPRAFPLGTDRPMTSEMSAVFRAARGSGSAIVLGADSDRPVADGVGERFQVQAKMITVVSPKGDRPYLLGLEQCLGARFWTAPEQRLFEEIGHRLADALAGLLLLRSLRESEFKLEAAQRVAHVGWWERDLRTGRVALSDEVRRIFGVEPIALPQWQERWLSVIHPEDRAKAAAASAAALRGGPRYDVEYRVLRPDGTERVVHSQGDVLSDDLGQAVAQFGVLQDITELRRAESEVRASEARFRIFVDHAADAFFLHDEQLRVVDVNQQACKSLGYTREELIGMHPSTFDTGLDPANFAAIDARTGAGETVTFETLHRRKDGFAFPVEIRVHRFQQGAGWFRLALVRDISERKRVEQRTSAQHAVAQILADATTVDEAAPRVLGAICHSFDWDVGTLWRVDREAGVLRCAHVYVQTAVDVAEFETATRASTFLPGVGLAGRVWEARSPASIPDMVDTESPRSGLAARAGLHGAFAFPILLGGDVLGVIDFFSRDVRVADQDTLDMMSSLGRQIGQFIERKRAEDALRVAQSDLTHVARVMTMGELTASIAHEVNQPLVAMVTSASSCSRWLAATPPNLDRAHLALERIVRAGTRASAVIDRVRTLVRREPRRAEAVDLNEIIREVITMIRHELHRAGVSLKVRLDELPLIVADRVQLQQVVLNLLLNAIDATRGVEGRPRQVWVSSRREGDARVQVEVLDSGVGLAPGGRERLFEAFYTTKQTGLGMGLSISKSIVEAHGGSMAASANHPHGAIFRFELPLGSDEGVVR